MPFHPRQMLRPLLTVVVMAALTVSSLLATAGTSAAAGGSVGTATFGSSRVATSARTTLRLEFVNGANLPMFDVVAVVYDDGSGRLRFVPDGSGCSNQGRITCKLGNVAYGAHLSRSLTFEGVRPGEARVQVDYLYRQAPTATRDSFLLGGQASITVLDRENTTPPPVNPPPVNPPPGPCNADVTVYGMPGSKQGISQGNASRYGVQVGATMGQLRQRLANDHVPRRVRYESIDYPAILMPNYGQSKNLGYSNAYQKLERRAKLCPKESFVFVGYSQSAHIIGDLMNTVLRGGGPVPASRIVGVALISDPGFNPGSPAPTVTRMGAGVGVGSGVAGSRPAWPRAFPVRSVCINGDLVCDSYLDRANPALIGAQVLGQYLRDTHSNGYVTQFWPHTDLTVPEYLADFLAVRIAVAPRA